MTNFKDEPVSISQLRATKTHNPSDWKPRDALIATLREIDAGEIAPTELVICMSEPGEGPLPVTFSKTATTSYYAMIGVIFATLSDRTH